MSIETTILGGGCFWCLEAVFQTLRGVESVMPGYAGGPAEHPSYRDVCSGSTGHAEVVQLRFDSRVIGFRTLLEVFFTIHDPTTPDRQGADVGTQYRSVIFYASEEQRQTARRLVEDLTAARLWTAPVVTQILPAPTFYPAESYHQDYFRRNPGQGYCQAVISPKLGKLRARHAELLLP